jgi:hypothetical protein
MYEQSSSPTITSAAVLSERFLNGRDFSPVGPVGDQDADRAALESRDSAQIGWSARLNSLADLRRCGSRTIREGLPGLDA